MFAVKLKELRKSLKITQTEIAKHLGIAQDAVSKIESGKRTLTSYEIFKIARALDIPIRYFYGEIELDKVIGFSLRATEDLTLQDQEKIPILRRIANRYYDIEDVLVHPFENILRKYAVVDDNVLRIREIAIEERKILGFDNVEPITNLAELLRSYNIIILEPVLEFAINGLFLTLDRDRFLIVVNHDTPPSKRNFTLAHEYGHYLFHRGNSFNAVTTDIDNPDSMNFHEKIANAFAAEFLMPKESLVNLSISDESIALYMHNYKISRAALINRLYSLRKIDDYGKDYYLNEFRPMDGLENLGIDSPEVRWFRESHNIKKQDNSTRKERKRLRPRDLLSDGYITAILDAYERGLITYNKIADYLFINENELKKKVKKKEVEDEIF